MGRTSRAEWIRRVGEWQQSGLTATEYARRLGANEGTLKHWIWRLSKEESPSRAPAVDFVEVMTGAGSRRAEAGRGPFEIELEGGVRVRVPHDFDAAVLERLLAVVRR